MKRARLLLTVVFCVVSMVGVALAVPPDPRVWDLENGYHRTTGAKLPVFTDDPNPLGMAPTRGDQHYPVICIYALDKTFTYTTAEFDHQLFSRGVHETGSMYDYYSEVSYGQYQFAGEVAGWYQASKNYAEYTEENYGLSGGAAELALEAVQLADADIDYSQYDNDGDGKVEGVIIIHQGRDGAETGNSGDIWSHVSGFGKIILDGVELSRYSMNPEISGNGEEIHAIGTFCHEFGHVLGLPDLYTSNNTIVVGDWCIMASGSYAYWGKIPTHHCAWNRIQLGWISPIELLAPESGLTLPEIECNQSDSVYKIPINDDANEYFLISNRCRDADVQFDRYGDMWDSGLLVFHCDDNIKGGNTNNPVHWAVEIKNPAPDKKRLNDAAYAEEDAQTEITPDSTPDTAGWYLPSGVSITNVSQSGHTMSFDLDLTPTLIYSHFENTALSSTQFEMVVGIRNVAFDAENVNLVLATDSSQVNITRAQASLNSIPRNTTMQNDDSPFLYEVVSESVKNELAAFTITATADGGYVSEPLTFRVIINPAGVLFIDDDQDKKNRPEEHDVYFTEAFDALGIDYLRWENAVLDGAPELDNLLIYNTVIWNCGMYFNNALTDEEEQLLAAFLDNGGNLVLSSQEYLYQKHNYQEGEDYKLLDAGEFGYEYLHIHAVEHDEYYYQVSGVGGDPITEGMAMDLTDIYSEDPSGQTQGAYDWWPDDLELRDGAAPIFTAGPRSYPDGFPEEMKDTYPDDIPEGPCALRYPAEGYNSHYKVVFFAFAFESLPLSGPSPNNRVDVLANILDWFAEDSSGISIYTNQDMYYPGDAFNLSATVRNDAEQVNVNQFVILDVYGAYYFWPGWGQDLDYRGVTLPAMFSEQQTILEFEWPDGAGAATGIKFWAALMQENMRDLYGYYDWCEWGFAVE